MAKQKKAGISENFLDERTRAEDILLGGLGFDTDVVLVSVSLDQEGHYTGQARSAEGETLQFRSEDPASALDRWAVSVLKVRVP